MKRSKDTLLKKHRSTEPGRVKIDLIFLISLVILFIAIGYGWRMHHENKARISFSQETLSKPYYSTFTSEQKAERFNR